MGVKKLNSMVEYQDRSVVSRTIIKKEAGTVTLFAFSEGEELSEHTAPYDALVYVFDGKAKITISGESNIVGKGDSILMPAGIPHAIKAETKFKMMLIMIRSD
jgi:quercetin dioxygenase-like cupin family protein